MKKIISFFFILVLSCGVFAQTKIDSIGLNKLKGGLKAMSVDADLVHANWGFCLMDPTTGKVLAEYGSEKSLTPASSQKVITTIAAMNILGADYTYKTYVEYTGTIGKDSVLTGDLYIRGTGDPTLGSMRIDSLVTYDSLLEVWALKIKEKGITTINGKIIADASYFEDYTTVGSWNWDDIGQYYGAGASGLNFAENKYTVYFSSNASRAKIDSIRPEIDGMTVWNDVRVGGTGDEAYIYGAPDNYYRYVTGTIPANRKAYEVDGSMPDPPLFLALALKSALDTIGIHVTGQATTQYAVVRAGLADKSERKALFTHSSVPLKQMIFETNQHSINLYAETFLKTIGKKQKNDGSRDAGVNAENAFYSTAGLKLDAMHIEDGSGLSRLNYFSPKDMCSILRFEMQQNSFTDFLPTLPVAGQSGTLKTMGDNTAAEGRIFAKSGSMYKVRSYSGYVQTKSGQKLVFCVMVNNYTCGSAEIRAKLEKLMVLMAGV